MIQTSDRVLLTEREVPDVPGLPMTGEIPGEILFPLFSKTNTPIPFFIHHDGALFQVFECSQFPHDTLSFFFLHLSEGMAVQFYKLKVGTSVRHFVCLRADLDHQFLKIPFRHLHKMLFGGLHRVEGQLHDATLARYEDISRLMNPFLECKGYGCPEFLSALADASIRTEVPRLQSRVGSNLGLLYTGRGRLSTLLSLKGFDTLPEAPDLLRNSDYLLTATCIRPAREQAEALHAKAMASKQLLSVFAPKSNPDVARPSLQKNSPYFIQASFLLTESTLPGLNKTTWRFHETLADNGLQANLLTVGARAQYISLFPGNATYGSHYDLAMGSVLDPLFQRILAL